jgi:hypothetical protein
LAVGGWFATYSDGRFLVDKPLPFAYFYDAQGDSLLRGEFNVPCESIGGEAFVVNGQCYGYFGITPSLLRIPLNFVWPEYRGRWAPLSVLTASGAFLVAALWLVTKIRLRLFPNCPRDARFHVLSALFLLALGLASTNIFLLSRPVVYHEAIIWSVSLALGAMACAFNYLWSGHLRWLVASNLLATLSLNARPVAGAAALTACGLLPALRLLSLRSDAGEPSPLRAGVRHVLIGAFLSILSLGSYLAVIHGKFGAFEAMPIRYNLAYDAERRAKIDGSMFHLSNFGWNAHNFFGTTGIVPRIRWPRWWEIERFSLPANRRQHPEAKIDSIEPYMSVTVAMSALFGFAVIGLVAGWRRCYSWLGFQVLCVCTAFGPILLLFFTIISYRYFHEYLLWFAFAGAFGVTEIRQRLSERRRFHAILPLLALLVGVNLLLNTEFALRYQLHDTFVGESIPAVRATIDRWQSALILFGKERTGRY